LYFQCKLSWYCKKCSMSRIRAEEDHRLIRNFHIREQNSVTISILSLCNYLVKSREKSFSDFCLTFSLLLIIIIGSISFLNMALSKPSSHIPLLTSDGIRLMVGPVHQILMVLITKSFFLALILPVHHQTTLQDYTSDNISGGVNNSKGRI
jgi:hypothetical protein